METEAKYLVKKKMEEMESDLKETYEDIEYVGELYLPAIYYDTDSGNIGANKAALRIRQENGKWIGCYKATTEEDRRFIEEEIELSADDLENEEWFSELTHFPDLAKMASGQSIKPRLKIETRRRVYNLSCKDMLLEIVLDWVDYLEGTERENRLEVELKKGDYDAFNSFIIDFKKRLTGLKEINISKYEKGNKILNNSA